MRLLASLLTATLMCHLLQAESVVSTVVGTRESGFAGDGGPAVLARLSAIQQVAVDSNGELYIADFGNARVRKRDAVGIISTVAGTGVADDSGDGGLATEAALTPIGICLVGRDLYVSSFGGQGSIRKISLDSGIITTVAKDISPGTMTKAGTSILLAQRFAHRVLRFDVATGTLSTIAGTGVVGFSGDGGSATSAQLSLPHSAVSDAAGNIYIADRGNHRIRRVDTSGTISTVCGSGVPGYDRAALDATQARLYFPADLAIHSTESLLVLEQGSCVLRSLNLTTTQLAAFAGIGFPLESSDGCSAAVSGLYKPTNISVDASGNIYVTEPSRIRMISPGTPVGSSDDIDADGFPDLVEETLGTLANDPSSHPARADGLFGFTLTSIRVRLNFDRENSDLLELQGTFLSLGNLQHVLFNVADVEIPFRINENSKASRGDSRRLTLKYAASQFPLVKVSFKLKILGDLQAGFAKFGFDPNVEEVRGLPIYILARNFSYVGGTAVNFVRARNGKSAVFSARSKSGLPSNDAIPGR